MRFELTSCGALIRYAAPLYVDIKKTIITRQPDGEEEEIEETYPKTFLGEVGVSPDGMDPCAHRTQLCFILACVNYVAGMPRKSAIAAMCCIKFFLIWLAKSEVWSKCYPAAALKKC